MMIAPKRLSYGRYVDLNDLQVDDVNLNDINRSLNHIYRFTGHYKNREPLTVAQHTKLCIILADMFFKKEIDVKFDCLLHDMPEAYYGDIATPVKRLLKKSYKGAIDKIDNVVYEALWPNRDISKYQEIHDKSKTCDLIALDIERRAMWDDQRGKDLWPDSPDTGLSLKKKVELFEEIQNERYVDLEDHYKDFEGFKNEV